MKKYMFMAICAIALTAFSCSAKDKVISYNQLPAPVKTFIGKVFPGEKIATVIEDSELLGKDYTIKFANGNEVETDAKGLWKEVNCKNTQVPAAIIPAGIRNYVAKNYPGTKIVKIDRDRKGYEIELNNRVDLEFDANAKFIRIDV